MSSSYNEETPNTEEGYMSADMKQEDESNADSADFYYTSEQSGEEGYAYEDSEHTEVGFSSAGQFEQNYNYEETSVGPASDTQGIVNPDINIKIESPEINEILQTALEREGLVNKDGGIIFDKTFIPNKVQDMRMAMLNGDRFRVDENSSDLTDSGKLVVQTGFHLGNDQPGETDDLVNDEQLDNNVGCETEQTSYYGDSAHLVGSMAYQVSQYDTQGAEEEQNGHMTLQDSTQSVDEPIFTKIVNTDHNSMRLIQNTNLITSDNTATGNGPHKSNKAKTKIKQVGNPMMRDIDDMLDPNFKGVNKCSECDKIFKHRHDLKKHFIIHTGERPWICQECGKSFTRGDYLQTHMRIHTGYRPYKCDECGKDYYEGSAYRRHMRTHTGVKPYSCEYCSKSFAAKHHYKNHVRIHTGDKPYVCPDCGKGFTQSQDMQRHVRKHSGIKPFKCDICERSFIQKNVLLRHLQVHDGTRPYQCPICLKHFVRKEVMNQHVNAVHNGCRNFECEICGKRFSQKFHLSKHRATHTGDRPFKCAACGKSYILRYDLERHIMLVHTGELEFKCEICGKKFMTEINLKNHIKSHKSDDYNNCDICKINLDTKAELVEHVKMHLPVEAPYQCVKCHSVYLTSCDLENHIRTHTSLCMHTCPECNKEFSTRSNLKQHMNLHSVDHKFQCQVCKKIFTNRSNLQRHEIIHMSEEDKAKLPVKEKLITRVHLKSDVVKKKYVCEICEKTFANSSNLSRHRKIHKKKNAKKLLEDSFQSDIMETVMESEENLSQDVDTDPSDDTLANYNIPLDTSTLIESPSVAMAEKSIAAL